MRTPNIIFIVFIFAIIANISACKNQGQKPEKKKVPNEVLIRANKVLVKTEDQKIQDFLNRYKWEMKTTPTGLRYMVYKSGKGNQAILGQTVSINFTSSLLNGSVCYSSQESGPKTITLGKGDAERGLEEGILLLKKGDRAKFIIPSHLAFGLVGDGDKIPAKATLIYDLEIIQIK